MLFNSLTFVLFFAAVLALHALPIGWRAKKAQLLVASYVFYAAWNPPLVLLLWLSTIVDWEVAARIHRAPDGMRRRLLLFLSLAVNLGVLATFKYGGFLVENTAALAQAAGIDWSPAEPDIVLPVGISFYTFQTLAYTLDVYLRRAKPEKSFLDFALFVTFFPQLVAGPIVRPDQLIPQFRQPVRASSAQLLWGFGLITLGLFEKVVLADTLLATAAEQTFAADTALPTLDAWIGVTAFAGQIFCDFAGYSTTAIGVALCLGFSLPDNFRYPYAAIGFSDFWRRWHISLSTWLRDYLYIPLGGNRKGRIRTHANLMVTMLLGGLWHGASWTFVIWGGLHGLLLIGERLARRVFAGARWVATRPGRIALILLTFALVNVTWVFFRAEDLSSALAILASMVGLSGAAKPVLWTHDLIAVPLVMVGIVATHLWMRNRSIHQAVERIPWWLIAVAWATMAWAILTAQGSGDAFIYFQF